MKVYSAIIFDGVGNSPKLIEPILATSTLQVYKELPKRIKVRQIISVEEYDGNLIDLTK